MFIDASAIVAIITYDDDRDVFLHRLDASKTPRYVAPTTVWESAMAIATINAKLADEPLRAEHIQLARAAVAEFLLVADAKEIVVTADTGRKALHVAEQYVQASSSSGAAQFRGLLRLCLRQGVPSAAAL